MSVRLMTFDPGHFHAALVQKTMYAGVAPLVHVYAPLGPDLLAHLGRVVGFNTRAAAPTSWELEVHAGPEPLQRLLREKPGNVVVLSGRNRTKIDALLAAVQAGLHVLADKPWIIDHAQLPTLQEALDTAAKNRLVAWDIMTERYEITSLLQRALVHDPAILGDLVPGMENEPGVFLESVHYLLKLVAGVPNRRPPWFFDIREQGEGLTDVGTHLVDLVPWLLFPEQPIRHDRDLRLVAGARWPTRLTREQFSQVTGADEFPAFLQDCLRGGVLDYFCNNRVRYTIRGVHVTLNICWDYEAATGAGDTHRALVRGGRAHIEVRQGREENYRPELYVLPQRDGAAVAAALRRRVDALQGHYPGLAVSDLGGRLRVDIPERYRVGHEAHFSQVTEQFLKYLADPASVPAWERDNLLAKYFVTTAGVREALLPGHSDRDLPGGS